MADNVVLNNNTTTGSTLATDDVSGVHYQRVKLADGTADSATAIAAGGGVESDALRVTIASDSTGVLSVDDNGGSLTVDGTVSISGTVSVDSELTTADLDTGAGTDTRAVVGLVFGASGGGTLVSTTNPLPIGDNGSTLSVDDNGGSLTIDGTVAATQSGTWNVGTVTTITNVVHVDDNASSLTVDGTVAATQSGTWTVQPGNTANTTPWLTAIHDGTTKATVRELGTNDALNVAIVDGSGNQIISFGGGTEYTEDAVSAANPVGTQLIARRRDTLAGETSADGDSVAANATDKGELYVKHVDSLPVTDNGGSLTVDNAALAVTGGGSESGALRVTVATDSTGVLSVDDNGGSLTVDGTVAVSGTVTVGTHPVTQSGTWTVQPGDTPNAVPWLMSIHDGQTKARVSDLYGTTALNVAVVDADGNQVSTFGSSGAGGDGALVDGANSTLKATVLDYANANPLTVSLTDANGDHITALPITDNSASLTVDNAALSVTGGGVESAALRVTIASDSTGVISVDDNGTTFSVDDGGSSLTVDGTVAATQSGTWNIGTVTTVTNVVHVDDNSSSLTVDNSGTFAVQATIASGATSVAKAEDVASADADVGIPAMAIRKATPANTSGTDGDYEMLQMAAGRLWVDASGKTLTVDGSGVTQPISGTVTANAGSGTFVVGDGGGSLSIDDNSGSITVDGTVAATQSGIWTVQPGNTPNTVPWLSAIHDGQTLARVSDLYGTTALNVAVFDADGNQVSSFGSSGSSTGDGTIVDGNNATIKATVIDYANANPLAVSLTDANGDHVTALPITDNSGSLTVDNAGTFAVQAAQSGTWNVGTVTTITNVVHVDDNASSLTVDGTVAVSSVTTSVTPGTSAAHLGKAEDAAHADGDTGVMALAVRKNTAASTSGTDGDYQPLITNTTGHLWVDASGQTLTVGSHAVTNAGTFAVQSTIAASATNIAKAEDVASADADVGVPAMAVRKATPANTSGTDGDYEMLQMSAGRLWTSATIDAALPAGTNVIGHTIIDSGSTTAVTQATGTNLHMVVDSGTVSTITNVVHVDDNSGSLTVDGTVAATQLGTWTAQPGNTPNTVPWLMAIHDGQTKAAVSDLYGTTALNVVVVDADGNLTSPVSNAQVIEDAPSLDNPSGEQLIVRRRDTLTSETSADGDYVAANATNKGELYVKHVDAIAVTDNSGSLSVDDGAGSLTVDGTVAATQSGTWNIGTVTTVTNVVHIDDNASSLTVDNTTLSVTGGGVESTALRVTIASDSTGVLSVDDNGGSLTIDGSVTVTQATASSLNAQVVGPDAHDAAVSGNPVVTAGRASSSAPTAVSADGDVTRLWVDRRGAMRVALVDDSGDSVMDGANNAVNVNVVAGGAGNGAILDGVDSAIKATVLDYSNANPLAVRLTDTNGDYIGAGAGTQYTEDAVAAADPVGSQLIARRRDTLAPETSDDGDVTALNATSKGELYIKSADPIRSIIHDGMSQATVSDLYGGGALNVAVVDADGVQISSFGGGTQYTEDAAAAANPTGSQLIARRRDALSGETTTDGDNVALNSTDKGELYVKHADTIPVTDNGGSLTIDNATLAVVGGGVEASALRVTIASDSTGVLSVDDNGATLSVDDGGSSLTVDGTVAATQSGTWNIGTVTTVTNVVHVDDNSGSLTVDGTIAATQSGTWTMQPGNTPNTAPWLMSIHDGQTKAAVSDLYGTTALNVVVVDADGNITSPENTTVVEDAPSIDNPVGPSLIVRRRDALVSEVSADGDYVALNATAKGELYVKQTDAVPVTDNSGSLTVDNAGTFAVQAAQSGTWNIGTVTTVTNVVHVDDNSSTLSIDDGAGSITVDNGGTFAVQATIAAGATSVAKAEDVASADADVGIPAMAVRKGTPANTSGTDGDYEMLQISAGRLWASATIDAALPAGTNAIGKLAANDGVDVGDVTINNASGGSAVNIQDGGNSITVDYATTGSGTATGALRVELANNGTGVLATLGTITNVVHVDDNSGNLSIDDGGNSITVDNAGTFAVQATLAAGATAIAKAEDVASADADVGVPAMAIRKATPANTSGTDGDYEMLQMSAGRLWASATIDAALPAGANAIGKLAANSGVTIGAVEIAASQTLATVTNVATIGTSVTPGTSAAHLGKAEDVAHADGDTGVMALAVRKNTAASTSGSDGDYQPLITNTTGHLWVDASGQTLTVGSHAVTNAGTFAVQSTIAASATNIAKAEDVASADADVGVPAMAVRKATPANTSGTDGDYEMLQMSAGRLWASTVLTDGTTTAGVIVGTTALKTDLSSVAGTATSTAASGVQKVGIVGNAGATIDSTVAAGTAPTNAVIGGSLYNNTAPAPTTGQALALQSDQAGSLRAVPAMAMATLSGWTSATSINATQTIYSNSGAPSVLVHLVQGSTISGGAITFEVSYDNSNWVTIPADSVIDPSSTSFTLISLPYTLVASTNKPFLIYNKGWQGLRIKLSTAITGSATVTPNYALLAIEPTQIINIPPGPTTVAKAEDVASADADVGVPAMAIRKATPANTSGTDGDYEMLQVSAGRLWASATIDAALPTGTNTIGNIKVVPGTTGGFTTYHLVSAATTNATVVKASAGQLFGWYIYNSAAAMRKLAFHNASSTPTAGASIFFTLNLPAGAAANVMTETGIAFSTGISITTVTGLADSDATAVAANDLNINLFYA